MVINLARLFEFSKIYFDNLKFLEIHDALFTISIIDFYYQYFNEVVSVSTRRKIGLSKGDLINVLETKETVQRTCAPHIYVKVINPSF